MSNPGSSEADNGFLTIDQAIAIEEKAIQANSDPEPEPIEDNSAPDPVEADDNEITDPDPTGEDADGPVEATESDIAEDADEGVEGDEPEPEPVKPPPFWDADKKELFKTLPREAQEYVLAKEAERDKATSRVLQEAAEKRKVAEAEASRLSALGPVLDKLVEDAQAITSSRWDNVDWDEVLKQYGADEVLRLQNMRDKEVATVQRLQTAKATNDHIQTQRYVAERLETLKAVCPDLVAGQEGVKRQDELVAYLEKHNVPRDVVIRKASAEELSLAYKAMLWDKANATAKTEASKPKPKVPNPAKPALKPSAPAPSASSVNQRLKAAEAAFRKNPSVENLVALEKLKGK